MSNARKKLFEKLFDELSVDDLIIRNNGSRQNNFKILEGSTTLAYCEKEYVCTSRSYEAGRAGANGLPVTTPPPVGVAGVDGAVIPIKAAKLADVAEQISVRHTGMLLASCGRFYLNGNFEEAIQRLLWLKGVLDAYFSLPVQKRSPESDELYRAQLRKTNAYLQQIKSGLDFYAQPMNQVPLLSVESYNKFLESAFNYANSIEKSYLAYRARQQRQEKQSVEFIQAVLEVKNSRALKQAKMSELAEHKRKLQSSIDLMQDELIELWVQLLRAENSFKNAVVSAGQGCGFAELAGFAAAVVTLVTTGGATAASISTAIDVINKKPPKDDKGNPINLEDNFSGFTTKVKYVATAGSKIGDFVKAFNETKKYLFPAQQNPSLPSLPNDSAKILSTAEEFDRQIEPYMKLDEAKAYRQLMRSFVKLAQTKNNKILEYDKDDIAWHVLAAEIIQAEKEIEIAQAKVSAENNPFVFEAAEFMKRAWEEARADLVRTVFQLERAYRYYSLNESGFRIEDFSVAALGSTARQLLNQYQRFRENQGAPRQEIRGLHIDLMPYISRVDFARFCETGSLSISIDPQEKNLAPYCRVLVNRIVPEFKAGVAIRSLSVRLIHHGQALIRDEAGHLHEFCHVPIPVGYRIQEGREVIDGSIKHEDYEGVSPYGPWSLQVDVDLTERDLLKSISGIGLKFDGLGRRR